MIPPLGPLNPLKPGYFALHLSHFGSNSRKTTSQLLTISFSSCIVLQLATKEVEYTRKAAEQTKQIT